MISPPMKMSADGRRFTEGWEGRNGQPVLTSYQDSAGVWTIGYGHTKGVISGMTCTPAQADQWMTEDLTEAEAELNWLVDVILTQNEFDALCDWEFNCGGLAGSTLLRLVNKGEFEQVPGEMARWCHARVDGQETVVRGLVRRRAAEGVLWLREVPPNCIPVPPIQVSTPSLDEGITPMRPPQHVVSTTVGKLQIGSIVSGGAAAVTAAVQQAQPAVDAVHQVQGLTSGLHGPVLYAVGALVGSSILFSIWTLLHKHRSITGATP